MFFSCEAFLVVKFSRLDFGSDGGRLQLRVYERQRRLDARAAQDGAAADRPARLDLRAVRLAIRDGALAFETGVQQSVLR
eukprot:6179205-Pleurochrysis_carterae.AAC.1